MAYHFQGFAAVDVTPPANPTCTSSLSWVDPFCWGVWGAGGIDTSQTPDAYIGLTNPPAPLPPPAPVPTVANPNPLVTPPASGAAAQGTVDATIAASVAANQAALQAYYATVPTSTCDQTILPSLGICDTAIYWAAGALALLGFVYMAGGRR